MGREVTATNIILAIVTTEENREKVGGGTPIFLAKDEEELDHLSMLLARLTLGMVHDLDNGMKIIIRH